MRFYWHSVTPLWNSEFIYRLFQLENTKSQDGKQTLLHFLVNTIESKYPEVLEFSDEMLHVEQAARGMIVINITHPAS